MPRKPLERRGVVEQLAIALVGAIQSPDVVELLDRLFDRQREVRLIRNQLGERVGLRGSETERAADVLDRRARLHRPERHDLADGLAPVLLPHVLDHLAAPLEAEVHVDVGHRDAFRIEEALEQEVVEERIDVGDAQRIRDERSRCRSAARAYGDSPVAGGFNKVGDDEEVASISSFGDDAELVVESLAHVRRQRIAVALLGAARGERREQVVLGRDARRKRERGQVILLSEFDVDLIGDAQRVFEHVRPIREVLCHLRGALEVEPSIVAHPVRIAAILAEPDAEQHVVRVVVAAPEEVGVVGGDDGESELLGECEHARVQYRLPLALVRLNLEVVAILEELRVPARRLARRGLVVGHEVLRDLSGQARRRDDDPLVVLGEQLAVYTGARVEALGVGQGRELDEIPVPDRIAGQKDQMVVGLGSGGRSPAGAPVAGRHVRLHSNNRLDPRCSRVLLELPGRVEVTVIGDRQGGLLELLGPADQVIDSVGAVEEGELGVAMQVDEAHFLK